MKTLASGNKMETTRMRTSVVETGQKSFLLMTIIGRVVWALMSRVNRGSLTMERTSAAMAGSRRSESAEKWNAVVPAVTKKNTTIPEAHISNRKLPFNTQLTVNFRCISHQIYAVSYFSSSSSKRKKKHFFTKRYCFRWPPIWPKKLCKKKHHLTRLYLVSA